MASEENQTTQEHRIRKAMVKDADRLYEICRAVELAPDPERMADSGFLMTQYSKQPKMKKYIQDLIRQGLVDVAETAGTLSGFLVAYPKEEWRKKGWSSDVVWSGMDDPLQTDYNFAMLEKIAVDPNLRRQGIATALFEHLAGSLDSEVKGVFTEIVEGVYRRQYAMRIRQGVSEKFSESGGFMISQGIRNDASIAVAESFGAVKAGRSRVPYQYSGSYLGKDGLFVDGVYRIDLEKTSLL
ncbi:GNAT family N-acetyltransferase [Candidatus Woesearchaeota archaeon]|nr:GNAT family N-acetyltransferase [Candidatus Woesearchaeota archaeon]